MKRILAFLWLPLIMAQFAGAQIVIDHTCVDLEGIPGSWVEAVQDDIPSHYAHTSHGGQLTYGLQFIEDWNSFYDHARGVSYLPAVSGAWCIFDGQESASYITPDLYWETGSGMDLTRDVLDNNPEIETSMWCWCTQVDYYSQAQVQAYLDSMSVLESEYPGVTFIYFTGNAQGTGSAGYNRWQRNNQIRDYCQSNGKILFDFADLDCWWWNPSSSSWEQHTYEYSGYDIPSEHPEFNGDEYAHTTAESCWQKGEALWYMMALIAGWQGTGISTEESEAGQQMSVSAENPSEGVASIQCRLSTASTVNVSIYSLEGRLVSIPYQGLLQAGTSRIYLGELGTGIYIVKVSSGQETCSCRILKI
jgi:hypothetical protein